MSLLCVVLIVWQRTKCEKDSLFMTLPTYFAQNGFVTAGDPVIHGCPQTIQLRFTFKRRNNQIFAA